MNTKHSVQQHLVPVGLVGVVFVSLLARAVFAAGSEEGSAGGPASPHKLPVPDAIATQSAEETVNRLYAEDFAKAVSAPHKAILAARLLRIGLETNDDTNARYVLWRAAHRLAIEGGRLGTAFAAIEALNEKYRIDALSERTTAVVTLSSNELPISTAREVADNVVGVIKDAVDTDRFDLAGACVEPGLTTSRRVRDGRLESQLQQLTVDLSGLEEQYTRYRSAAADLEKNSKDRQANLVVGTYLALRRGDWIAAEQHMVRAGAPELQRLFAQEFSPPNDAAGRVALGDAWWELSETRTGIEQSQCQIIAADWYAKALNELSGLTKRRVQDRLDGMPQRADVALRLIIPAGTVSDEPVYLSDLEEKGVEFWEYAPKFGFGKNGKYYRGDRDGFYSEITLAGKKSPHGIFAHPKSRGISSVRYEIGKLAQHRLLATIGVDDARRYGPASPLTFEVWGDGKLLWESKSVILWGQPQECDVDVRGVNLLELRVRCPGDAAFAYAVWCEPRLVGDTGQRQPDSTN